MVYRDAEDKAPGVRRKQKAGQYLPYSNRTQGFRLTSQTIGNQSLGINRAIRKTNTNDFPGGIAFGGILDQLIADTRQQLTQTAEYLQRLEALQKQLKEKSNK